MSPTLPNNSNGNVNDSLQSLVQSGYELNSFQYPLDLTTNPANNHYMIFNVNVPVGALSSSLSKIGLNPNTSGIGGTQFSTKSNSTFVNAPAANKAPVINQNNQGNDFGQLQQNYSRVATSIAMYMPPDITVSQQINWSEANLGHWGNLTEDIQKGSAKDILSDLFGINRLLDSNKITDITGITELQNVAERGLAVALNPHAEVLFRGIPFRAFSFHFVFAPRSEDEAQVAWNIIQAFKFYSLPEINQGPLGRYFVYPAEFDIAFYSNGQRNDFLPRISTCALTAHNVKYADGNGWSAFRQGRFNGAPVKISLDLDFVELEIMTKNRALQGY